MAFFLRFKNTLLLWVCVVLACAQKSTNSTPENSADGKILNDSSKAIVVGANRTGAYLPLLRDKQIAVVANHTSVIFKSSDTWTHLVDSLLRLDMKIDKVFAPEHGFRGTADAGEVVEDGIDQQSGLPVVSLYGNQKKPSDKSLEGVDLILFDIQDVGVRFYTYIATLQYVMEAAAANDIPIVVLDRPNPNASFIDGPTMEDEYKGFLGLNNIPLVYGMTIGEYAQMINEEGWMEEGNKAELTVIELENYTHDASYSLPIRPSPNLPNDQAIALYPSLGLFEGTTINAGRGTEYQFQRYGSPYLNPVQFDFTYTPEANFGAKYPKFKGVLCHGEDLSQIEAPKAVDLSWLIKAYTYHDKDRPFFLNPGMERHAGTKLLQEQIESGLSAEEIRRSWAEDLEVFGEIRKKYLLYP